MKLLDRVALVTGGGRGIGRAIPLALARERAHVAVTARTGAELDAVAAEVQELGRKALPVRCDVSERSQVDNAVRQVVDGLGPVQILVSVAVSAKLLATDGALWERHLRVNLSGAFLVSRAVLPGMLAAPWGPDRQRLVDCGAPGIHVRSGRVGASGPQAAERKEDANEIPRARAHPRLGVPVRNLIGASAAVASRSVSRPGPEAASSLRMCRAVKGGGRRRDRWIATVLAGTTTIPEERAKSRSRLQ